MDFTDYRANRLRKLSLEEEVNHRAGLLGVVPDHFRDAMAMLAPLGAKREGGNFHRNHSLRVGLLASEIGDYAFGVTPHAAKALFFAGLLHDVGKALVPMCTLCATEKWSEEDRKAMEPHVLDGFRLLRDRFDFTSHVIARHHKTQSGGYQAELPPSPTWSERTVNLIEDYARALTIADVFDAMHRVNSGSGGVALTEEQIKERMLKIDPLVEDLYRGGVLVF